jgi:hypothetical protein
LTELLQSLVENDDTTVSFSGEEVDVSTASVAHASLRQQSVQIGDRRDIPTQSTQSLADDAKQLPSSSPVVDAAGQQLAGSTADCQPADHETQIHSLAHAKEQEDGPPQMTNAPRRKRAGRSRFAEDFRSLHSTGEPGETDLDLWKQMHRIQGRRVKKVKGDVAEARATLKTWADKVADLELELAKFALRIAKTEEEERLTLQDNSGMDP